ncbi:MAG: AzlC family ABC transporter permease [Actinomycetota bacterium]|nr:AzlC family ABC transporter permease [Actinomycetota bacterium]
MGERLKVFWSRQHRRDGFLLGLAVGTFGITFGVLSVSAGVSGLQAVMMSLLMFTGASQFAAVGVLSTGGDPISTFGAALLLAARNGAYALSMSRVMPARRGSRLIAAQLIIDESAAMAEAQCNLKETREAFWITGLSVFLFWNLGTLIGVLVGGVVGNPLTWGLDAAFPAGFLALLGPHLKDRNKRRAALIGAAVAAVGIPFLPAGLPVLLAASGAVVVTRIEKRE